MLNKLNIIESASYIFRDYVNNIMQNIAIYNSYKQAMKNAINEGTRDAYLYAAYITTTRENAYGRRNILRNSGEKNLNSFLFFEAEEKVNFLLAPLSRLAPLSWIIIIQRAIITMNGNTWYNMDGATCLSECIGCL